MLLPIRTTLEDLNAVCVYLATKPTGATLPEAKAVVDKRYLDGRKMAALKLWGLIEEADDKIKITEPGRRFVKDSGSSRSDVLRDVVRQVPPYLAVIERVAHRNENSISATEVAAHWYEHFRADVSDSEKILNDQAVCFFHIAQGADLGELTIGRRGMPTRFDCDADATRAFVDPSNSVAQHDMPTDDSTEGEDLEKPLLVSDEQGESDDAVTRSNQVFISHGKNHKILEQVKEIVTYGKFQPVIAKDQETAARPVPEKVMDAMRACRAAVIHVSTENLLYDADGNTAPQINANVLIEIGAAMALYDDKFVLLVEEGVVLPSNLQGLYECRYQGDELSMPATMKLLRAFSQF